MKQKNKKLKIEIKFLAVISNVWLLNVREAEMTSKRSCSESETSKLDM